MATIDRDEAIRVVASYPGPVDKSVVRRLLMQLPEDVEIIRCEDCKYNPENPRKWADDDTTETFVMCLSREFGPDDFCSKAKRWE